VKSAKPSPPNRKRRPSRSRDPDESRRALVDAAAALFNSVGYHGTDSNRIARAAGYAPGTFYTHFPDKRAIFLAVYESWVEAELTAMSRVLEAEAGSRPLRSRLAAAILEHHRKWQVFRASLRALYATDPVVREARLAQRQRQIETMAATFESRGRPVPSRAAMLARLLTFEVMCDAVADGDSERLGIAEADILALLVESLRPLPQ
jgi:AcrR family transcriptional regulator